MAKQYKSLDPLKYYRDYFVHNIRPDGREFLSFRPVLINTGSIATADGSSIVKIGNTSVICGIKAELTQPKLDEPNKGFLVPDVELPPLCSSKFRPGPPSDTAQIATQLIVDILENACCIHLEDLCIYPEKLAWVLYCDMICLDFDGSVIDACVLALISALKTVTLPHVEYDPATDVHNIIENTRKPLAIYNTPMAVTFAIFDDTTLLADPTSEEENLSTGLITIVMVDSKLCLVHKPGGTPLSKKEMDNCLKESVVRANMNHQLILNVLAEKKQ